MSRTRHNPAGVPLNRRPPMRASDPTARARADEVRARYAAIMVELLRQMWSDALASAQVRPAEAASVAKALRYAGRFVRDYLAYDLIASELRDETAVNTFMAKGTALGARGDEVVATAGPSVFAQRRAHYEAFAKLSDRYFATLAYNIEHDREAAGWRAVNALGDTDTAPRFARHMTTAARELEAARTKLTLGNPLDGATRTSAQTHLPGAAGQVQRAIGDTLGFGAGARLAYAVTMPWVYLPFGPVSPTPAESFRKIAGAIPRKRKATP